MGDSHTAITITGDANPRERREANHLLARPPGQSAQPYSTRIKRGLVGWIIFVAVATVLFVWLKQGQPPAPRAGVAVHVPGRPWSPADRIAIGMAATGAACIVLLILLVKRWNAQARRRWRGRDSITFDERGVTQRRPGMTQFSRWTAVRGFEEGETVFVIRVDKLRGLIVPKRELANDQQRDQLRDLLRRNAIRPAVPIPLGFELGAGQP